MRNLWIGLLTVLARTLQTWSESVTRRVERYQRSAAKMADPSPVTDGQVIEMRRPPADWNERVKAAQPPAHWQAKVQRSQSDSTLIAQPIVPDAPRDSMPEVDQIERELPEDAAPEVSPPTRSITRPHVPVKLLRQRDSRTTSPISVDDQIPSHAPLASNVEIDQSPPLANVAPHEDDRIATPLAKPAAAHSQRKIEFPVVEPQPTKSNSPSESEATWRKAEATSQNEQKPTTSGQIKHETRTPLQVDEDQTSIERRATETRDLPKPEQAQPEPQPSFAESSRERRISPQATNSPQRAASMPERVASIDLSYPPESPVERETLAYPSPRRGVEVSDPLTTHWPGVSSTDQSAQTWATVTSVKSVETTSSAFDQRWPTLPDEPPTPEEEPEIVWRERERVRRLDLEQRGLAWNA